MRTMLLAAAAVLLGACSGDSTNEAVTEARAEALQPGEYEVTTKVESIRSSDQSTPASKSKPGGEAVVTRTCVPADGTPDPALFAEAGETCNAMDNYLRSGRMSLQYKCNRAGQGQLTQLVDGTFKQDSFEAKVMTTTYFAGAGDYELTRSMTGKRVGDCPAAGTAEEKAASTEGAQ